MVIRRAVALSVSVLAVVAAAVVLPGAPVGAATTTLRAVRSIDTVLTGNYSQTGTWEPYSSPGVGDITGDGRPEIVAATVDGSIAAYDAASGAPVWQRTLGRFAIHSSPVLADMDGDDVADVVIGGMNARVYWLDGPTGETRQTFAELPPLYCPPGTDCRPHGFFATPAVVDLDGDGKPEIVAPSWDHTVYAWRADGTLMWRTYLEDTLWSSPAVADIDGNGTPELVLGGDIWPGNPFKVPQGGLMWVLQADGQPYPGYPLSFPGQVIWSSPAVADVNRDGQLDVVVGTGTHEPFGDGPAARQLYAFTLKTRRTLPGWPQQLDGRATHGPALGDLDGDGGLDVAIGSEGGWVTAFRGDGRRLWRTCAVADGACGPTAATHGSVAIADIDNDGAQEVVGALDRDLLALDGASGAREAAFRQANATYWPAAIPAIFELGGQTTIVMQTIHRTRAHEGPAAAGDVMRLQLLTTGQPLCRADWPMFKQNPTRSGTLPALAWLPFGCPKPFVTQLYTDFLGRKVDADGLAFWTGRMRAGWSGPRVIQAFMDSKEFGRVRSPLVRLWIAVTGSPPASAEVFDEAARRYASGTALGQIARELISNPATVDAAGVAVSTKTNEQFVRDTTRNIYGREPSAQGLADSLLLLSQGTTRGNYLALQAMSPAVIDQLVPEVYVTMSYVGMLDRIADAGGYRFWVPAVRGGRSIQGLLGSFQRSTEYSRRVLSQP